MKTEKRGWALPKGRFDSISALRRALQDQRKDLTRAQAKKLAVWWFPVLSM